MIPLFHPGFYTIKGMLHKSVGIDIIRHEFPIRYSLYLPLGTKPDLSDNTLNESECCYESKVCDKQLNSFCFTEKELLKYGLTVLNNILPNTLNNANIKKFNPHKPPLLEYHNDNSITVIYFHSSHKNSMSQVVNQNDCQVVPEEKTNSHYDSYYLTDNDPRIIANKALKLVNY